jgi:uncharacterized protein YbjT (DUF2867 family)
MPDTRPILVCGGTQGTGELIARRLLEERHRVRLLARTPEKAREKFGDRAEIVEGDVTEPATLPPAVSGAQHVIYTIGIPRRFAGREAVRRTVLEGTLNTLRAARDAGLPGRFMYMSALGTTRPSWLGTLLNLIKGDTLGLRREVEREIRASSLAHTIIHAGILRDVPAGRRPVQVAQEGYALRPRYRIARGDVAEVFVRAMEHPAAANTTFDVVWARRGSDPGPIDAQLATLSPDA